MKRGNLIIYDKKGWVISQTGESFSDSPEGLLPREYPEGVSYIELAYGEMKGKTLISVDVSVEPNSPIFQDTPYIPTESEKIQDAIDLYTMDLIDEGVITQ